jgi:plastocyanin
MRKLLVALPVAAALAVLAALGAIGAGASSSTTHRVNVPDADRFTPYSLTIHAGDSVHWVNHDGDAHSVVADNAFVTAGNKGVNRILKPDGGDTTLHFSHPGTFVYYCRFHSHLNRFNQPIAPGPDGGIQDSHGNFGTPMTGVITVLPR